MLRVAALLPFLLHGAMGGMLLDKLAVGGVTENFGMRGLLTPGDMFDVGGANRFWCGMLWNRMVSRQPNLNVTALNMSVDSTSLDRRADISPGDELTIGGLVNPRLDEANQGGELSFSYLPGTHPDFDMHVTAAFQDGGFVLGEPSYEVTSWPTPTEDPPPLGTGQKFSYTFAWPTDTYNGSYTIQVVYRPNGDNVTFVQCIDLDNKGGLSLPVACADIDDCTAIATPVVAPLPPIILPIGPELPEAMAVWKIALIVLGAVVVLAFLIWCIIFKLCATAEEKKPDPPTPEKKPEPEEDTPLKHEEPKPPPNEPIISSGEKDSESHGGVQIVYTDPTPAPEEPLPLPDSGDQSGESGDGGGEGSHGRVFHFRYIANNEDAEAEQANEDEHSNNNPPQTEQGTI